jgi:hypothetical protein
VPSLLAALFRDRLFSWPWVPDLYEVPAAPHNCLSDPHTWSVGISCETSPRVWAVRVGHCRCGGSPDRQVRFGIESGDVHWNRCPGGGVSLEHAATASRGIVFVQLQERQRHNARATSRATVLAPSARSGLRLARRSRAAAVSNSPIRTEIGCCLRVLAEIQPYHQSGLAFHNRSLME